MKTAILIHGNLRTFFMPLHENKDYRVCDFLMNNIVVPNDSDVFAVTDIKDFYGESDISNQLKNLFGERLKGLIVDVPMNISEDPKYKLLKESLSGGSKPVSIVNQYIKIKKAHKLMSDYETEKGFRYDIVFRGRFDNLYSGSSPLMFSSLDFTSFDVFVPGVNDAPLVFDWCAIGKRNVMEHLLNMYDVLGFTLNSVRNVFPAYRTSLKWDVDAGRPAEFQTQFFDVYDLGRSLGLEMPAYGRICRKCGYEV